MIFLFIQFFILIMFNKNTFPIVLLIFYFYCKLLNLFYNYFCCIYHTPPKNVLYKGT